MSDSVKNDNTVTAEVERLRARVSRLAQEKSYLQLTLRMIERIDPAPGLHDMVGGLLQNIVETIGGTNIRIWYWIEDSLFYADFLGARSTPATIDDATALRVAAEREFIEDKGEVEDSLMQGGVLPSTVSWVFPLEVGSELIGVVKLENISIVGSSLGSYLPIFFSHAALIISNEIRNHLRAKALEVQRIAASVFANSQEAILISDSSNCIVQVNQAFTRITGFPASDVIGERPRLLASGRHDVEFFAGMWQSIHETGRWHGEIWNKRKSGEVFPAMLSIDVVRTDAGQIQHYVGAFSDISQIKQHQADLERIAHYDTLTGLPNRRLLMDRLNQQLARSRRTGHTLAICFLDLDGFKKVNDQLGHDAGDQVLIEVAQRLLRASREGDTVSRLGGDEFVLLFCDLLQEQECFKALERVLQAVAAPIQLGDSQAMVSASIGVTLFPRDDGDADALLRHADQAMYQAKEAGKSCFLLFEMDQQNPNAHTPTAER
jgi:diguanylate cyclase (GGDEF)-like protein/PAS domain S-box-containing protein